MSECPGKYPPLSKDLFPPYISGRGVNNYKMVGKHFESNNKLSSFPDMADYIAKNNLKYIIGSQMVGTRKVSDFSWPVIESDFNGAFNHDRMIQATFNCGHGGGTCNCDFDFVQDTFPTVPGTTVSSSINCNGVDWPYAIRLYSRPVTYTCTHVFSTCPWFFEHCDRWDCDEDCESYLINYVDLCYNGTWKVYAQPEIVQIKWETMYTLSDGCGSTETGTQLVFASNSPNFDRVDHAGKCVEDMRDALVCLLVVDEVTCSYTKDYAHLSTNITFEIIEESDPVPSIDYIVRTHNGKIYDVFLGDGGVSWTIPSWGHYGDYRFSNYYKIGTSEARPTAIDYNTVPQFSFTWECEYEGYDYSPEGESSHCKATINGALTDPGYNNIHTDDMIHIGGLYRKTIFYSYYFDEVPSSLHQNVYQPVFALNASFIPSYGHGRLTYSSSFSVTKPPVVYANWVHDNGVILALHDCKLGLSVSGNTGCYVAATMKPDTPSMPVTLKCTFPLSCNTRIALTPNRDNYYVEIHVYASHSEVGDIKIDIFAKDVKVGVLETSDWELRGTETRFLRTYGMYDTQATRTNANAASDSDKDWLPVIILGCVTLGLIILFGVVYYCVRKKRESSPASGPDATTKCMMGIMILVILIVLGCICALIYFIVTAVSSITGAISAPIDAAEKLFDDPIMGDYVDDTISVNLTNKNGSAHMDYFATQYHCRAHYSATFTTLHSVLNSEESVRECVLSCENSTNDDCIGYVIDSSCRYMTTESESLSVPRVSYLCTKDPYITSGSLQLMPSWPIFIISIFYTLSQFFPFRLPRFNSRGLLLLTALMVYEGQGRGRGRGRARGVPMRGGRGFSRGGRGGTMNRYEPTYRDQPPPYNAEPHYSRGAYSNTPRGASYPPDNGYNSYPPVGAARVPRGAGGNQYQHGAHKPYNQYNPPTDVVEKKVAEILKKKELEQKNKQMAIDLKDKEKALAAVKSELNKKLQQQSKSNNSQQKRNNNNNKQNRPKTNNTPAELNTDKDTKPERDVNKPESDSKPVSNTKTQKVKKNACQCKHTILTEGKFAGYDLCLTKEHVVSSTVMVTKDGKMHQVMVVVKPHKGEKLQNYTNSHRIKALTTLFLNINLGKMRVSTKVHESHFNINDYSSSIAHSFNLLYGFKNFGVYSYEINAFITAAKVYRAHGNYGKLCPKIEKVVRKNPDEKNPERAVLEIMRPMVLGWINQLLNSNRYNLILKFLTDMALGRPSCFHPRVLAVLTGPAKKFGDSLNVMDVTPAMDPIEDEPVIEATEATGATEATETAEKDDTDV